MYVYKINVYTVDNMKLLFILIILSGCARHNTMRCDAYNGSNSTIKYKKWYHSYKRNNYFRRDPVK